MLAATLIFSGFVKAVDPLGTQYKIEDYLTAAGMSRILPDWATLTASAGLAALEFTLGICLLFAIQRRLVTRLTLVLIGTMTAITLWLAVSNPISDCGCFGDAIHLTNWQTFWKNALLLACAAVVAWQPLRMMRLISETNQWIVVNYTVFFIAAASLYSLYALPVFDFRPYHVGANIKEGMEIPEGAERPQFQTTFILEKDGRQQEFTLEDYPDSTWTFVDSKTIQTKKGYVPPIHDLSIVDDDGNDLTDDVLEHKGYSFMLVAPHLENSSDRNFGDINIIYEYARQHGYPFFGLTASGAEARDTWRDITGAEYPFYTTDETTLKTIIRSNPGLLLLRNGTIIQKWSHNKLPTIITQQMDAPLEKLSIGKLSENSVPKKITYILLWFALPLALLSIADRLWMWTKWIRRKRNNINPNIN
ncbi:MAG: DoxX family protein [Prevotella sp.]|nr:DoxX family protein [Prevotella sp.]